MSIEQNYIKTYNEFWRDIVENPGGEFNKDQFMRELADYHHLLENVPKVYSEVTGGTLSKLGYDAQTVISLFYEKFGNKAANVDILPDDWDLIVSDCETIDDVRRAVFGYLDISEDGHSKEYHQIRKEAETEWPAWKREAYNNQFATSAHSKKLLIENKIE